jgi:hypothetical protein
LPQALIRFEFEKSRQFFIRVYNETLSVAAMCVLQSRLFTRWNQSQGRSPKLQPFLRRSPMIDFARALSGSGDALK